MELDFHFDQNAVYGDKRIAGIPIHVYEAQFLLLRWNLLELVNC